MDGNAIFKVGHDAPIACTEAMMAKMQQAHGTFTCIFLFPLPPLQLVELRARNVLLSELKRFERMLFPHLTLSSETAEQGEDSSAREDKKPDDSASDGALKITLHVLKEMGQRKLASELEKRKYHEEEQALCVIYGCTANNAPK